MDNLKKYNPKPFDLYPFDTVIEIKGKSIFFNSNNKANIKWFTLFDVEKEDETYHDYVFADLWPKHCLETWAKKLGHKNIHATGFTKLHTIDSTFNQIEKLITEAKEREQRNRA